MTWTVYTTFWLAFRRDSMSAEALAAVAQECTEMRNGVEGGRELM
jgi:hypothetical protein